MRPDTEHYAKFVFMFAQIIDINCIEPMEMSEVLSDLNGTVFQYLISNLITTEKQRINKKRWYYQGAYPTKVKSKLEEAKRGVKLKSSGNAGKKQLSDFF